MGQKRVELLTPALSERCSNQLSYCPVDEYDYSKSQKKCKEGKCVFCNFFCFFCDSANIHFFQIFYKLGNKPPPMMCGRLCGAGGLKYSAHSPTFRVWVDSIISQEQKYSFCLIFFAEICARKYPLFFEQKIRYAFSEL